MQDEDREPAEGRPMPELPPNRGTGEPGAEVADDELPPEPGEEARRWEDVPIEEPEESTGIDAG